MKKILIITYYWPPAGGIAVQRWLKFVKYLPSYGWKPILVIPENPSYPIIQEDYLKDIPEGIEYLRVPIHELGRARRPKGSKEIQISMITTHAKTWKDRLKAWVRGNVIIPDARVLWIRPVVKAVSQYLKDNPVDVMVTNGPPHSLHLAGLRIKQRHPELKWLADFRDPWTRINYYEELKPGWLADTLQKHWERKVVRTADMVTTVSESGTQEFLEHNPKAIYTLPNGFDDEDFNLEGTSDSSNDYFSLRYVGSFMANQNYPVFWKILNEIINENEDFKNNFRLELIGNIDYYIKEEIALNNLANNTVFHGYVSPAKAIEYQQSASALLLFINQSGNSKGMMTGKLFSYLASRRPIILMGPKDGNAAGTITYTESGRAFSSTEVVELKLFILNLFKDWKEKRFSKWGNSEKINQYNRKNLTSYLVDILNNNSR